MRTTVRWRNLFLPLLLMILTLVGCLLPERTSASELPRSMVIADEQGFTVNQDGKYFIDIPNVMPGKTYTKEITLRSTDSKDSFDLGLRVHPQEATGTIDFNEHVEMTLELEGKEIYKGKMLGDDKKDWSQELLTLGRYEYGTDRVLKVVFEVDENLTSKDYEKENTFLFVWEFVATKDGKPIQVDPPKTTKKFFKLPQTGEEWRGFLYKFLVGLLLILIALLLWKKNRDENRVQLEEKGETN